jgi:hypothetical protein
MLDPVILYSLIGGFALLFALSALEKYQDMTAFQLKLENYQVLPAALAPGMTNVIFMTEIVATTLLLTPAYLYGLALSAFLMLAYTSGIAINLVRGRTHIDCGCLGSQGEGISGYHLLRNSTLLILLAVCFLPVIDRHLVWLDYSTIILFLGASAASYATANLMIAHANQHRLWWS